MVCYAGEDKGSCDIDVYQCKRYEHPIRPSEFWVELGKLCVYTQSGELRIPRRYRLVASRGVGGTLADLFENPERLRTELIKNWKAHCETGISRKMKYPLTGALKTYVENFPFKIVGYIPVRDLLVQHKRTPH